MSPRLSETGFLLNGEPVSAGTIPVQTTLLDFLRDRGLTGAKEGCAEGECGACTVLMVAEGKSGTAYRPVNSCLLFAPMLAGQEIYTVEALAQNGKLNEAQQAMAAGGGSQCGYCTPGFVMSLFAEHYRPGRVGPCDPQAMGGNLCRCTGYRPIEAAALSLGAPPDDPFRDRLSRAAPQPAAVHIETKGGTFDRPCTLEECFALQREYPDIRWIAGGTDLAVESNLRFRRWQHMASLEAVAALREFSNDAGSVRIGAGLPLSDIADRWTDPPAAFLEWIALFASPTIRNRATLGGNLATASPIGDGAPLLIALDASVALAGPNGERTVPLDTFFTAYRRTSAEPGELIRAIVIPAPIAFSTGFYKVAKRRLDDISTVAAAMSLDLDHAGTVRQARFAFGGVAPIPLRATAAEEAAIGRVWNHATVERVQEVLERSLTPISDHRGSAEYRKETAKSLIEKFWWEREGAAA